MRAHLLRYLLALAILLGGSVGHADTPVGYANGIFAPVAAYPNSIYGAGADGAVVLDGVNAFPCGTRSGSTYTQTRDCFMTTVVVNPGVTWITAGYRWYVNVSCTNNGIIHNNGASASNNLAGAAAPGGTLGVGTAGANGGVNASGSTPVNVIDSNGGKGGNGGAGGANAGGIAPAITAPIPSRGDLLNYPQSFIGHLIGNGANVAMRCGGGGAGGGSNNAGATGGGGGGGAGCMVGAGPKMINNGTISCDGGAGANATASAGSAGGGGGGGGGWLILTFPSWTGANPTANGGAGGSGAGGGIAGTAGANGRVSRLN